MFVLGGAKIQDAFLMMDKVLTEGIADKVLAGGLVGNVMLVAQGIDIGKPSTDFIMKSNLGEYIERSKEVLERFGEKIVVPEDLAYANGKRVTVDTADLPEDAVFMDIGEKTAQRFAQEIMDAKTVFVNGPVGVFEKPLTEYGTQKVWEALAGTQAFTVLGGGAMVRFLSGEELPVVAALKYAAKQFGNER